MEAAHVRRQSGGYHYFPTSVARQLQRHVRQTAHRYLGVYDNNCWNARERVRSAKRDRAMYAGTHDEIRSRPSLRAGDLWWSIIDGVGTNNHEGRICAAFDTVYVPLRPAPAVSTVAHRDEAFMRPIDGRQRGYRRLYRGTNLPEASKRGRIAKDPRAWLLKAGERRPNTTRRGAVSRRGPASAPQPLLLATNGPERILMHYNVMPIPPTGAHDHGRRVAHVPKRGHDQAHVSGWQAIQAIVADCVDSHSTLRLWGIHNCVPEGSARAVTHAAFHGALGTEDAGARDRK
jgi:hypothetical protein